MFGHIGKDCRAAKKVNDSNKKKPETLCIEGTDKTRMRFRARVNSHDTIAVLDTGSDYTLMKASFYARSGLGKLSKARKWMKGFSPNGNFANGSIQTEIEIEGGTYELIFHVVQDTMIPEG